MPDHIDIIKSWYADAVHVRDNATATKYRRLANREAAVLKLVLQLYGEVERLKEKK